MKTKRKSTIKFIIILALAIELCAPATSTTIMYVFKCKSNDANSTMMHESRLMESRLEDNGNIQGYQTGSFNYLQTGRIEFVDLIAYHDEHDRSLICSLVLHNMTVFFEGDKGISEFFAKDFFPDRSVVFSKKAIRFEEFSGNFAQNLNNNFYNLGKNNSATQINVNANVLMGPNRERNIVYDFAYNASVANGVIETWDTMGWNNKTGARRTDWEQTSLIKGNISIENNLLVSKLFDMP
jgi:hypothetical protein